MRGKSVSASTEAHRMFLGQRYLQRGSGVGYGTPEQGPKWEVGAETIPPSNKSVEKRRDGHSKFKLHGART